MQRRIILYLSLVFMVAILAGYVFVYQTGPFSEEWNNFLLNVGAPFGALAAAVAASAVFLQYNRQDKPYLVWLYFTLAMWTWVLAETTWSAINFISGELPALGLPDVLWFAGYGLLTAALHRQYQLVYQTKIAWWKVVAAWVGILVVTYAGLAIVNSEFTTSDFVEYLYASVDFALCIASIRLFMTFGAGRLSRPWMGLFVMGISDTVYAWLNATGQYQVSV